MRAHRVDFSSWVSGRRKWGVERRGPGRTKENRRREQQEKETQGRHVQPVVLAEELAEQARREHAMAILGTLEDTAVQGTQKRRRLELMHAEVTDSVQEKTRVPEPVAGSATRGKRKRTHRTAADAKRRREAAAFGGTDTDEGGPAPARPVSFSAPEVEEPDNPMNVG